MRREIFLCKLISNISDVLHKMQFESLINKSQVDTQLKLFIHIILDRTSNSLSIIDSCIGKTKSDVINNLVIDKSKMLAVEAKVSITS